jgi:glycosyltransferase involved in cell wall biosynthesis
MKINLIIPSFYPATIYGGPIFSTLNTCKELVKLKDVSIYVSTTNANMHNYLDVKTSSWIELEQNLFVKYYNDTWINKLSLPFLFSVWKDIKQADVVHVQAIFSTQTPIALFYAVLFNKPVFLSPRGSFASWIMQQGTRKKKLWLKYFMKPFSKNIYWHATAQQEKEEIISLFPDAKVYIIPNGINLDEYKTINKLSNNEYVKKYAGQDLHPEYILISMGRLHAKKNFDMLIDSFARLDNKYANSVLLIAGDDETEKTNLERQIKDLNLESKVFLIGSIGGQDKVDFLANADLFVLPSHNENFGNVYAESLAAGTPIIASTNTPWEEVEKYNCGKWVNNTIEETTKAIEEILSQDLETLGENGQKYISKFEWKNIAKEFHSLFQKIQRSQNEK